MHRSFLIPLLLALLLTLTACTSLSLMDEKEQKFSNIYPNISMQGYIQLRVHVITG